MEVWELQNWIEWKSDNYGIEETTSIQTGRRGKDAERGWAHTHVDKNPGGMSQEQVPQPTPGPPAQDSSARKMIPSNFWMQKPVWMEKVEEAAGALSSSSWGTHTCTHLLRLTSPELQHRGGSLKSTSGI